MIGILCCFYCDKVIFFFNCKNVIFTFYVQIYDALPAVRCLPLPFQEAFRLFRVSNNTCT